MTLLCGEVTWCSRSTVLATLALGDSIKKRRPPRITGRPSGELEFVIGAALKHASVNAVDGLPVATTTFGRIAVATTTFGRIAVATTTFGRIAVATSTFGRIAVATTTFGRIAVATTTFGRIAVATTTFGRIAVATSTSLVCATDKPKSTHSRGLEAAASLARDLGQTAGRETRALEASPCTAARL